MQLEKGGIYEGTQQERHRQNTVHYIICVEDVPDTERSFLACIISSDGPLEGRDNLPMCKEHFVERDENGKLYKIQYKNSHLVKKNFKKDILWINPQKVGRLTDAGINFVLKHKPQFGSAIFSDKPIWEI